MIKDSPFHTSATLVQKVRQSIYNRDPPMKSPQQKNIPKPLKHKQHAFPKAIHKNPIFSRPSLQHINYKKDQLPVPSIQSCKQIEDPFHQNYLQRISNSQRNPFHNSPFKFQRKLYDQSKRKDSMKPTKDKPEKDNFENISKNPPSISSKQDKIFKYEDFEDQLNQMLKDQRNARQLLNLISQKQNQPQEQSLFQNKIYSQKQIVAFGVDDEKGEQYIDFDALRQEQFESIQYDKNKQIRLINSGSMHYPVIRNEQAETKLFLLSDQQVQMKRYYL